MAVGLRAVEHVLRHAADARGGVAEAVRGLVHREVQQAYATFSAYILRRKTNVFFRSVPTARSPRAATHDSRLEEKFVDFEEV